jgi:hypothetical protein
MIGVDALCRWIIARFAQFQKQEAIGASGQWLL